MAYPIEDKAAVHFAYGHFFQFPSISAMFSNADYSVLQNLQAGGISYGVLGNPDVKPEQTVQYEIGYKHALSRNLGFELTAFYKDIRDLLGVEFIETYNGAEYARLTNVDFGNVFGITLALDHRQIGPASLSFDYTWQQAQGNSSDPRETATRAAAGEDPRPRLIPFNWDQRHTFNLTMALAEPQSYTVSAVLRVASGQPYSPVLETGFGQGLETNSGRKPTGVVVDLRAEKFIDGLVPNFSFFARVFNLFDTKFFNGMVFNSTGSPYYSRFTEADFVTLLDPSRFYPPRRIEIGFRLGS
jgi:outer membrane receptor protein involved in Fe transport